MVTGAAKLVGWGFGIILSIWLLYSCMNSRPAETVQTQAQEAQGAYEAALASDQAEKASYIAQAEGAVTAGLRDPESASFAGVTVRPFMSGKVVCGYVNARNGFGGMGGLTPFVVVAGAPLVKGESPGFAKFWRKACR